MGPAAKSPAAVLAVLLLALAAPALAPAASAAEGEGGAGGAAASTPTGPGAVTAGAEAPSLFFSEEDGWLDVSRFLDEKYGFLPIVRPITEPAVGYGAAGGLAFLSKPLGAAREGLGRPSITAVVGLGTENGTWGAGIGDLRHWLDDRVQTQAAFMKASMNLDFYGAGTDGLLAIHPLRYNLDATGGYGQVRYRLGDTTLWAGLGYAFARTVVELSPSNVSVGAYRELEHTEDVGAATPSLMYDSRDTLFTPRRGTFAEARINLGSEWLGGDSEFQRLDLTAIQYFPLHEDWTLGVRGDLSMIFGDAPFFLDPYVGLRGAPAVRYQGEDVASLETELRWQFWGRWSLVGFVGAGAAWNDHGDFEDVQSVVTGGGGFRYELARAHGIHAGLDFAFGPDGFAFYIQVGSAWARA